jgi:hypothetical protein
LLEFDDIDTLPPLLGEGWGEGFRERSNKSNNKSYPSFQTLSIVLSPFDKIIFSIVHDDLSKQALVVNLSTDEHAEERLIVN